MIFPFSTKRSPFGSDHSVRRAAGRGGSVKIVFTGGDGRKRTKATYQASLKSFGTRLRTMELTVTPLWVVVKWKGVTASTSL